MTTNLFPEMSFASATLASHEHASSTDEADEVTPPLPVNEQISLQQRIQELKGSLEHGIGTPDQNKITLSLLTDAKQRLSEL